MVEVVKRSDVIAGAPDNEGEIDKAITAINVILKDPNTKFPAQIPAEKFGRYGTVSMAVTKKLQDAGWFVKYQEQHSASLPAYYRVS